MKINKKVILPATLGSLLAPQLVNADTTMFDISDVEHIGKVNNKDLVRGSHVKQEYNSNFKGYFNGGLDIVNVPYNRPYNNATVMLHGENDREVSYGSGMFVSPRVIVTAAHLFLRHGEVTIRKDHMINGLRAVLGHNTPMNGWSLTSGEALRLNESNIHIWNERDFSVRTPQGEYRVQFYNDLAVVTLPKPMQLISPDKKAEFNELATGEEMDKIKDGDTIRYIGYPTSAKKGDQNALTKDIERGRLYEVQGKVIGYTDPETGKPYYKSKKTGETNPYYPLARFLSSGLQGMSGSGVLNADNKVVGVFQSVRDSRYGGGPKQGQVIPDAPHQDSQGKASGGMFFTKAQRDWIRGIIEQNKVTGFYQDSKTGKKYYFGEDQHMVRSTTKIVDGHNYSFDEAGVATDLGEVKRGNVYIKYVLDTGEEFINTRKLIDNKEVGTQFNYNVDTDEVLKVDQRYKLNKYKVKTVDKISGEVTEGDTYITVILTKVYEKVDLSNLHNVYNKTIELVNNNKNLETNLLSEKEREIYKKVYDNLFLDKGKIEDYFKIEQDLTTEKVSKETIDNLVNIQTQRIKDFEDLVDKYKTKIFKVKEYNKLIKEKEDFVKTVKRYDLSDKNYIKEGSEFDNFNKLESLIFGEINKLKTINSDDVNAYDEYIKKLNNIDETLVNKYNYAYSKILYKETKKTLEDIDFEVDYVGVDNKTGYNVTTAGVKGQKEIVEMLTKQGDTIIKTEKLSEKIVKESVNEVRTYNEKPKKEQPKVEEPKKEQPKVEEPKKEQPKVEEPKKEQPKVEEPKKEQPKVEEPKKEQPKVEEPKKEQLKVEEPKKEQPKVEEPKKEQPKAEELKKEVSKVDESKKEQLKAEEPKKEQLRVEKEQPKVDKDQSKVEKSVDKPIVDKPKVEQPSVEKEQSKVEKEQPKVEKPVEKPIVDKPKVEELKKEVSNTEVSKNEFLFTKPEQGEPRLEELKKDESNGIRRTDKPKSNLPKKQQSIVDETKDKILEQQVVNNKVKIKGDKKTKKYHFEYSPVYNKIHPKNAVYFNSVEEAEASGYVLGREIGNYPRINKQNLEQSITNNNDISPRRKLLPETGDSNNNVGLGLAGLGVVFGLWLTRRNERVNRRYKRF